MNTTIHRTSRMKPVDVKDNLYIDSTGLHSMELHSAELRSTELQSNKDVNDKDPKFKVGDHVKISKEKKIFAKGYTPNWYEEVFVIKKVKNREFHGHALLMI